jgi:NAD(P)-dependent dehydrogenase (short-subunit alcohol dehydrogenase family)
MKGETMKKNDFEGKVVLITGSSRGIGLATAREFGRRGAKVVLNARGEARLEKARESLSNDGYEVISVPADVTSPDACRDMIARTVETFGRLDVLINNAGISMRANFEDLDAETCRNIVDINLMGCIYPTLYAIPEIKKNQGSIVFTSSIAGLIGLPTASLYCATKSALRGFADSLRCELTPEGVHIGVVYVGFTENDPEKTVVGAGGDAILPARPAHMSWVEIGKEFAEMVRKRQSRAVLTPVGKLAELAARVSPDLAGDTIVFSRKHKLNERLGIR